MRNYRNVVVALVLALAFAAPAYADDGIIYTGIAAPTPTPTPMANSTTQNLTTDGIMYPDVAEPTPQAADTVTEIALSLLQSVLSLV